MRRVAVLNVVGLDARALAKMPRLRAWAARGSTATIEPLLPAVTCSMQSTYLTGVPPSRHGIVGNGWYDRDDCEPKFWKQSNRLVQSPKLWEVARAIDRDFTCANLFWWFNMYSSVDYAVTPRPIYTADGRKIPDIFTKPADLRCALQDRLGRFPLFNFWGPMASIASSEWIAAAARYTETRFSPTLSLVYLPHLDYGLQRLGPHNPEIDRDYAAIDDLLADLIAFYEAGGVRPVVLSEYGIDAVAKPIAINRELRAAGFLCVREECGRELLDPGSSAAFALVDHQIAHVYVNDPRVLGAVRASLERVEGIETLLGKPEQQAQGLAHARSGDLVAVARSNAWFSYYYWEDDRRAPNFARTVDIHRKPGYDPAELFIDPALRFPRARIAARLLGKALGFRTLMDVVPLRAELVKGSHGAVRDAARPIFISHDLDLPATLAATAVYEYLLAHCFPQRTRTPTMQRQNLCAASAQLP